MGIQIVENFAMICDVCGEYSENDITPIPPDNNKNYVRNWYEKNEDWVRKKSENGQMIDVCPKCSITDGA